MEKIQPTLGEKINEALAQEFRANDQLLTNTQWQSFQNSWQDYVDNHNQ